MSILRIKELEAQLERRDAEIARLEKLLEHNKEQYADFYKKYSDLATALCMLSTTNLPIDPKYFRMNDFTVEEMRLTITRKPQG